MSMIKKLLKSRLIHTSMMGLLLSIMTLPAQAVADQNAIHTITIWKIHPGKHQQFIHYMQQWETVFAEIKQPPMIWYRKISDDSYDFVSISLPFNAETEKAMEAAGQKRGLPIGYNYTLKLNEFADSYTSTVVEGPQSMNDLLKQIK